MMKLWVILIIVIIFVVVAIIVPKKLIRGGLELNTTRPYPLVFVSSCVDFTLKKPKKWALIKQTKNIDLNKKVRSSILKSPTLVIGTALRDDIIYDKPDMHIHLSPVLWDLSNPVDLVRHKQTFENIGVNWHKYWETLGRQDIDVLLLQNQKNDIQKYLDELTRIRAGLVVNY